MEKNDPNIGKKDAVSKDVNRKTCDCKGVCHCPEKRFKRTCLFIALIVIAIIFLGLIVGCFARMKSGNKMTKMNYGYNMDRNGQNNQLGKDQNMGRNMQNGGNANDNYMGRGADKKYILTQNTIEGKVTAVNDQVFTMDNNGQSRNVQVSSSTRFPLDSTTKINVGDIITVRGQQDSNGMIQAVSISVNP